LYALQDRYDLEDTPETEEKILKIVKERYRGWQASLSSTYKAYKTDDARMSNIPEDLQPEEWEWMIQYFGTDQKFKVISMLIVCELCTVMKWLVSLLFFITECVGTQPKELG
jgi:hypothetical protein